MSDYQNKNLFQVPATVAKIETMADKSLKLKVITQELNEEQSAMVFKLYNKLGWFVFSEATIEKKDIENLPKIEEGDIYEKPDHIRLSNVWWRIVEKQKGRKPTEQEFREFYHREYARIIDHYKEKLN